MIYVTQNSGTGLESVMINIPAQNTLIDEKVLSRVL
jgi:hypothetical protein